MNEFGLPRDVEVIGVHCVWPDSGVGIAGGSLLGDPFYTMDTINNKRVMSLSLLMTPGNQG